MRQGRVEEPHRWSPGKQSAGLTVQSEGRMVVSASCHVNDKGVSTLSFSGTGLYSGDFYTFVSEVTVHNVYADWNAENQTAEVNRGFTDNTLTNETTGEVWENTKLHSRVTINANGELVDVYYEPWECD